MSSIALQGRSLAAGYPGRPVFSGIDIELAAGEVLALIGPNGSGKTTLFRLLSGELSPEKGEVLVDVEGGGAAMSALGRLSRRDRARLIARVLQNEDPAWPLPVRSYVEAGTFAAIGWFGAPGPEERRAVEEALATLDLLELAERPVTELSGGEFRRVLIARALAQRPKVLLLDEPTSDLDLGRQMEILGLLRNLARAGTAVALSVHDLNIAALVADRVALLSKGRLVALGTPREVIKSEIIEAAYGAKVIVEEHPNGGLPQVLHAPDWLDAGP